MSTSTSSRVGRASMTSRLRRSAGRAREIWSELDYAQRRLLEIQTGLTLSAHPARAKDRGRRASLAPLRADRLPIPLEPPTE